MRRPRAHIVAALLAVVPSTAAAQTLHVFGPPGTGTQRRVLVVFESEDGRCVNLDEVRLEGPDGATVTLGEPAGACARWVDVASGTERAQVVLHALCGESRAEATVAMATAPLDVRAERNGEELHVAVSGVSELEPTRAVAVWAGGETTLARSPRGDYAGRVPADAMIGVVVSAGERSGAAGIAPLVRSGRPEVLIMESSLVVAAGGAPRTAAYLIVADAQARLSRNVPLQIASDRGRLRALDWLSPGVAAVALSAAIGVRSVDLRVSAGATSETAEFPAGAAWPAAATITGPEEVTRGEVAEIVVAATSADDQIVDPRSLVVRCGGGDLVPDAAGLVACPMSGTTAVIVQAQIAGTRVPLAVSAITVRDPEPPQIAAEQTVVAVATAVPEPPAARAATLRLAALAQAAVDTWQRPTIGAGGSLRMRMSRLVSLEVAVRYQLTFVSSTGQGIVRDSLTGLEHAGEVTLGARISPFDRIPLEFFAAGGLVFSSASAKLGSTNMALDELHAPLLAGVGTTLQLGALSLGVDGYVRAALPLHDTAWSEPLLRFGLEISGGLDVAP